MIAPVVAAAEEVPAERARLVATGGACTGPAYRCAAAFGKMPRCTAAAFWAGCKLGSDLKNGSKRNPAPGMKVSIVRRADRVSNNPVQWSYQLARCDVATLVCERAGEETGPAITVEDS